ncbi:hypothetical protein ABZ153_02885 [Streptomyces sp. NPDC006290]|uniref:hypothetical protein n=1 Tax=Streptomyces sp. NPDC006290 TaxID=3156745 RepID=UPI0033A354C0
MARFNEEQFRSDEADMRAEVKKYGLHHDRAFMKAFDGYMDQLHANGTWLNQGHTPNEQWSGDAATNLIAQFDRINALHVPADWWRENKRDKEFAKKRDAKAKETLNKKYLWSKTEPYYPAKQAAAAGGLILETSPPGKIFNGKNCGFENWSDAQVQADLWTYMSSHYVDGAQGPVEAVMLGGKVDNSVLTKHEWPHLKARIEAGEVSNLHVKVMGIRGDSQDSSTWSLATKATFNVHSQNSFDQIPSPGDPQFAETQNRWRNQEKARNASKSSSSSSSSQDSSSSGYSLKNFHKAFDDPNAVIVLSDPATGSSKVAESPQELSRVVSRQLTRADTNASLQGASRSATEAAVRSELQAQAAAAHSLDEKLTAFRAEQQRRASTSAWPGTQGYGTQLTQGMSSMGLGSSTADYSPKSSYPGTRDSYFPQGAQYTEKPLYTYPLPQAATGQRFPVRQTESPVDNASFANPPSPVGNTQSYNPSYTNTQERTPSTGSASSDFGAPLAQTARNPSPPSTSEAPAQRQSSSSGHGHSGGKKKKETKAPSGLVAWMGGAQYKKKPGKG